MAKVIKKKNKAGQHVVESVSGIPLPPFVGQRGDGKGKAKRDSPPGIYPFTRGIHPEMYRERRWTMRQYAGFGTAKDANLRYKYLLSKGTTGISVAFDLPTQMGRDPDHQLSRGEVGRVGVSISTLEDMRELLAGIPLEKISISMTINATAPILLAFLLVVAEERGVSWKKISGTTQNDILKEHIARGTYIYPPVHGLRLVTDLIEFCSKHVPQWNTVSISGYHMREAGCTAVEEVGLTLGNAISYVTKAVERGLKVDDFAPRLAFFFNCHNEFFEEVAKFRAARKMWAEIMKERFGAKNPRSMMFRVHTQTAGSSLTAQQPLNNVVRTTLQAFASVCGGTQSLHTNSFDEALALPTEASVKLALRTQQIIAYETGVTKVADPLGGSYLIEYLTEEIESRAWELLKSIDKRGGMVRAIEGRIPQVMIERSAYEYQRAIEDGRQIVVGVNEFREEGESSVSILKLGANGERSQIRRVKQSRKSRNQKSMAKALSALQGGAGQAKNLLPLIIESVRVGATLGEISEAMRGAFGEA